MNEKDFSEEFLSAFVDDQLTAEEKSRAYEQINRDDSLNRRVCELRKVRDLVQLAYRDVPGAPSASGHGRRARMSNLAAGVLLALGVAIGWALHAPGDDNKLEGASLEFVQPDPVQITSSQSAATVPSEPAQPNARRAMEVAKAGTPAKVLIHVNDGEMTHLGQALDEVDNLARYYREASINARIEVVMNGDGLSLVRADVTNFGARIARIQRDYDNVVFEACKNSIDRLRRDKGIVAKLLPGVVVIDSGVAQLMRRQNQGWAYIQV
ncbi:MAG: hypothetical protein AMJ84_01655 [Acidithiobacillales bacterium SM23_46]|jgi:intracellular sulfur oxidation DsrE/DsrF family protein|nr:MAG: hypothetical protein AMJ84_01655 [Acidithiobacillales bacterium SM23_46]KPL27708.1 MAG: hypothetical protein AMJ72_07335 [Acidithiobacillales bacterium SM1_46]